MKDVTAVTINWLTARRTLGAINSFKKFYPDIPLVVVDDASNERNKGDFFNVYNGSSNCPDLEFDPDTEKLKNIEGVTFIQSPNLDGHSRGHGACVDEAIKVINTRWMFHFHSDYRLTKPGLLEELMDGLDETYCGAGDNKTRHNNCKALVSVAAIYNVEAGKKYNISFRPVIYYNDNTISEFPGSIDYNREGAVPIEAGSYYIGKLHQLGYKIKWVSTPHDRYGIHMRWNGDLDEWNKYF